MQTALFRFVLFCIPCKCLGFPKVLCGGSPLWEEKAGTYVDVSVSPLMRPVGSYCFNMFPVISTVCLEVEIKLSGKTSQERWGAQMRFAFSVYIAWLEGGGIKCRAWHSSTGICPGRGHITGIWFMCSHAYNSCRTQDSWISYAVQLPSKL